MCIFATYKQLLFCVYFINISIIIKSVLLYLIAFYQFAKWQLSLSKYLCIIIQNIHFYTHFMQPLCIKHYLYKYTKIMHNQCIKHKIMHKHTIYTVFLSQTNPLKCPWYTNNIILVFLSLSLPQLAN